MTNAEEKQIKKLIDELADKFGLHCDKKEVYFSGYYLDRLWYKIVEENKIPLVAFEIERGVPNNERVRKDIMNIARTRAPAGYIILPHSRILNDPKALQGSSGPYWYKNSFYRTFEEYRKPFVFYCDIQIIDSDTLLSSRSLRTSIISF